MHSLCKSVRESIENKERLTLSPLAVLSQNSKGRTTKESPDEMRTCFMCDRDRIIHSKAFRRLKEKMQVFLTPDGDHYRTRLTHTLEVAQIARTIACASGMNEILTEAIALGHDLGHTPFGHAGEMALDNICPEGFKHNEQSIRVVEKTEKDGKGLNLTLEVKNGILCHTGKVFADTIEGKIVHYADRIAYINHDIDDSIRAGILKPSSIPANIRKDLGNTNGKRTATLVMGVVKHIAQYGDAGLEPDLLQRMTELREFMFTNVYTNMKAKSEEKKAKLLVEALYCHYMKNKDKLPKEYLKIAEQDGLSKAVCDYVSGMTDRFATATYRDIFMPQSWRIY